MYYRLSAVCGIVAFVLALPLGFILGVSYTEVLCLLAGILAAVALFIEVVPPSLRRNPSASLTFPLTPR
jgi:hypothetical protein